MSNLWYQTLIFQVKVEGGYHISIATDVPCHLWLFWTDSQPWVHPAAYTKRGLRTDWAAYWCYVTWHLISQEEPGDTIDHSYDWLGWQQYDVKWFRFHGTIGSVPSPSDSPIFHKQYLRLVPPPIEYLYPIGEGMGEGIGWETPPGIPHWQAVGSLPLTDSTHVDQHRRIDAGDFYDTQNTAFGEPIDKVVIHYRAKGPATWDFIQGFLYSYTNQYGPSHYLTDDWQNFTWELVNNPQTDEPWTVEEINDMQLGVILFNWAAPGTWCSEVYATVHRTP